MNKKPIGGRLLRKSRLRKKYGRTFSLFLDSFNAKPGDTIHSCGYVGPIGNDWRCQGCGALHPWAKEDEDLFS